MGACFHAVSMHRSSYWRLQWAWLSYSPQVNLQVFCRSLKNINTPVILTSITMAIPHLWTSISHLLFKGRSYWHMVVGLCWAPLLQWLLFVSFSHWQDEDVCCLSRWNVQLLDWAQWWEPQCARTETRRGASVATIWLRLMHRCSWVVSTPTLWITHSAMLPKQWVV